MGSGYPHAGPWDYLERVPLLFYGPGYIKAQGSVETPATWADVAPTIADIVGFHGFHTPDGHDLSSALVPPGERPGPPKVVLTMIWDGAGRNVLSTWPKEWPNLKRLIPQGTYFDKAIIGSAPTSTSQGHTILGTGEYPMHNGIVGNEQRFGNEVLDPWYGGRGDKALISPTLADVYDKAEGNKPLVALVGTTAWYLGMIGHGAYLPGGDKDFAVLRYQGKTTWYLPDYYQQYLQFPAYVNDPPPLSHYLRFGDAADGQLDGTWRGHDITTLNHGFNTPARMPYQTHTIEEIMQHQGFGKDDVPDLFYTNYKLTDEIGHIWTMNSIEMHDALRASDAELANLIDFLNTNVGRDRWVLIVSADHGSIPNPKVSGAWVGSPDQLEAKVIRTFDNDDDNVPLVIHTKPTHMWINHAELADNGYTLGQIAAFIQGFKKRDITATSLGGALNTPFSVPAGEADQPAFQAVFPTSILEKLPCLPEAHHG
jgi:predicted AlkP superfamily pyrophosphatase or phosphodiesterase